MNGFKSEWEKDNSQYTHNYQRPQQPGNQPQGNQPSLTPDNLKKNNHTVGWVICGIAAVVILALLINYSNSNSDDDYSSSFYSDDYSYDDNTYADSVASEAAKLVEANEAEDAQEVEVGDDEEDLFKTLQASIIEENKTLPMKVDEYTTMTKIAITKYCLTYYYTIDEDLIDMDLMKINKKEVKKEILKNLNEMKTEDDFMATLLTKSLKEMKINMRHHYTGDQTKKSVDIDFLYTEL